MNKTIKFLLNEILVSININPTNSKFGDNWWKFGKCFADWRYFHHFACNECKSENKAKRRFSNY